MTEDWVKLRGDQLAPRERRLRSAHHRGALGNALLRSRLAAGRRSPGRHRGVRRRAVRGAAAAARRRSRPRRCSRSRRSATTRAATSRTSCAARDDRHLDFAGRGRYQGVTREHYVEIELPDAAPRTGPLWLIAQGWVHPTDSSINVALGQGSHAAAGGPVAARRRRGGAVPPVRTGLGFPAGQGQDGPDRSRRPLPGDADRGGCGSRTNLEIFWDRLGWAVGRPDVTLAAAPARSAGGRSPLPRLLGDRAEGREHARAAALHRSRAPRRAGATSRATTRGSATSRELLADRGRSLRHHERRRRAAAARSRKRRRRRRAASATSCSSATAG